MRRPLSVLLSVALIPAAVVVPVLSSTAAQAHPVAPHVVSMPILAAQPAKASLLQTGERPTTAFSAVGASWDASAGASAVQVRVRAASGHQWSAWTTLEASDSGPDPGTADAKAAGRRVASEPLWAGPSDGVQTRIVATDGTPVRVPAHLTVELIDPGTSAADADVDASPTIGAASAEAATGQPKIYTRAQWGADESIRLHECPGGPTYSSTIKIGFVHHTVSSNDYSAAQVPAMIRSFYAYHVLGNGWCDIGYNFLVDRFGRLWEGRYGGIDRAVIGSHTGGFNRNSFAVSMIGTFTSLTPNSSMQQSIAKLMAWKLGRYYRNPQGTDSLVYAGGQYRFCGSKECPVGSSVKLNVVSGHRDADVGHTECPGAAAEATLPTVRKLTLTAMAAGLVAPTMSATTRRYGDGGAFTIGASALAKQTWALSVISPAGAVVRSLTGAVARGGHLSASWNGKTTAGKEAASGPYTLKLTSSSATGTAVPYTGHVTLKAPVELAGAAQVGYGATAKVSGATYAHASVTILQAPQGSSTYAPVATVTSSATGAFSWAYPATTGTATYAKVGSFVSSTVTMRVGPTIAGPRQVLPGATVGLSGTAPPGSDVQVFRAEGSAAPFLSATVTASPTGAWKSAYTADRAYSWYAVANGLRSPTGSTAITPPPKLTGPSHVNLHGTVVLTGTAPAGMPVQIWRRQRLHTAYALSATVTAGSKGTFSWSYVAGDDFRWYAKTLAGHSTPGLTQIGVSATGPSVVDQGRLATLTGTTLPKQKVEIWQAPGGSSGFVKAATVTARTDGTWSWAYTVTATRRSYALARDWRSATVTTLLAGPPTVSGPATATYNAVVHVTGKATPGDTVTLWLHRRGSTGYHGGDSAIAAANGTWSMSFRAGDDYRWYVTSVSGKSRGMLTAVRPSIGAPASATRGTRVTVRGYALPGQQVHVWFRHAGATAWTLGRTLPVNAAGRWTTSFVLTVTISWYAESRGLRSGVGTTYAH